MLLSWVITTWDAQYLQDNIFVHESEKVRSYYGNTTRNWWFAWNPKINVYFNPKYFEWLEFVLPDFIRYTIVHEIWHYLDFAAPTFKDFERTKTPITEYAKIDREEEFAESFAHWYLYSMCTDECLYFNQKYVLNNQV